jgi:hypothetical protein
MPFPQRHGQCRKAPPALAVLLVAALAAGCQTLGTPWQRQPAAERAALAAILGDLAARDEAVRSFEASAVCALESPELEAPQKFHGAIDYERPDALRVVGRQRALRFKTFELVCRGPEFVLDIPLEQKTFYYRKGAQFASVPFSVSPVLVAREMFFPEDWPALGPGDARITARDETAGTATFTIGPEDAPRREVTVAGPPWVIIGHTRFDSDTGAVVARTSLTDHVRIDGVLMPGRVEAVFPGEQTRMSLRMKNLRLNTEFEDDLFAIDWPDDGAPGAQRPPSR